MFSLEELQTKTHLTLGFIRSDGDLEVLATFNNGAEQLPQAMFVTLVMSYLTTVQTEHSDAQLFDRDDALDVIQLTKAVPDSNTSKLLVLAGYNATEEHVVELPEGRQFSDIKEWYMRYGRFFCTFSDGLDWVQTEANEAETEVTDYKRPSYVTLYATDGETHDYDTVLAETG